MLRHLTRNHPNNRVNSSHQVLSSSVCFHAFVCRFTHEPIYYDPSSHPVFRLSMYLCVYVAVRLTICTCFHSAVSLPLYGSVYSVFCLSMQNCVHFAFRLSVCARVRSTVQILRCASVHSAICLCIFAFVLSALYLSVLVCIQPSVYPCLLVAIQ